MKLFISNTNGMNQWQNMKSTHWQRPFLFSYPLRPRMLNTDGRQTGPRIPVHGTDIQCDTARHSGRKMLPRIPQYVHYSLQVANRVALSIVPASGVFNTTNTQKFPRAPFAFWRRASSISRTFPTFEPSKPLTTRCRAWEGTHLGVVEMRDTTCGDGEVLLFQRGEI